MTFDNSAAEALTRKGGGNIAKFPNNCAPALEHGEFYLTEVIERYSKDFPIAVVEQATWIPIASVEDVERANE